MRERKSDAVRRLVKEGEYKEALKIASGFRIGISAEDRDAMKKGYECMVWPDFYRSIAVDVPGAKARAVQVVRRLYGPHEDTE